MHSPHLHGAILRMKVLWWVEVEVVGFDSPSQEHINTP